MFKLRFESERQTAVTVSLLSALLTVVLTAPALILAAASAL